MRERAMFPDADARLREFADNAATTTMELPGGDEGQAMVRLRIDMIDAVMGAARHLDPIARRDKRLVAQILGALADRYGVELPKAAP